MELKELSALGIREKEAEVYLELLKSNPILANQLSKKANISRPSTYDYLNVLVHKGLASYTIKEGKKYFQATDPEKILQAFEENKKAEEEKLIQAVKNLQKIRKVDGKKTFVEVLEGKEGIKTVFNDFLKEKPAEMLSFGSSGASPKILPVFMTQWHEKRIKERLPIRVIYNNVQESFERIEKGPRLDYAEIRISPIKDFSMIGTIIYNDKVNLMIFDAEEPLVVRIKGKQTSKAFKDSFEVLWKHAKTLEEIRKE